MELTNFQQSSSCWMQSNSKCPFAFVRIDSISSLLVLIGWFLLTAGLIATAQSTTPPAATANHGTAQPTTAGKAGPQTATTQRHAVHHKVRHHTQRKAAAPAEPPPPPPPVPPAEQAAHPATITFSRDNLRIDADNSSLVQILRQVSQTTGLTIEGLDRDERIYGQYGPGPVTSTLSKLLDGAGYNYVIVGGGPGESPAKLLLTPASGSASAK